MRNGPGDPRDLIVNVILRVAVPAGALQPRRHDQARFLDSEEPRGVAGFGRRLVISLHIGRLKWVAPLIRRGCQAASGSGSS
jgi:hypothetical protein